MMRNKARGFTLVEIVIAIMVVSIGLTATMRLVPLLLQSAAASRHIAVCERLGFDMLAELDLLPFEDPESGGFGLEAGESSATRTLFDDIDDYHGYSETPPSTKNGSAIDGASGYTRSVLVRNVNPADYTEFRTDGTTDAKLITVTVSRGGMPPYTVNTVRLKGVERSP